MIYLNIILLLNYDFFNIDVKSLGQCKTEKCAFEHRTKMIKFDFDYLFKRNEHIAVYFSMFSEAVTIRLI